MEVCAVCKAYLKVPSCHADEAFGAGPHQGHLSDMRLVVSLWVPRSSLPLPSKAVYIELPL